MNHVRVSFTISEQSFYNIIHHDAVSFDETVSSKQARPLIEVKLEGLEPEQIKILKEKLEKMSKSGVQIINNCFASNELLSTIEDNLPESFKAEGILSERTRSVSFIRVDDAMAFVETFISEGILAEHAFEIRRTFDEVADAYLKKLHPEHEK